MTTETLIRRATASPAPEAVEAPLGYVAPGPGKPAIEVGEGAERRERNFRADPRPVTIANGWRRLGRASLDREGFAVAQAETALRDFNDDAAIERVYYPEAAALIRAETGATRVVIFDHTLRRDGGAGGGLRAPVRRIHNDYTARSAPRRLGDIQGTDALTEAAEFAIVNVWRPLSGPVLTAPLAFADARSVDPADLVATDLIYPERVGEIYHARYNPAHQWVYYPRLERDEALLIKGHDSRRDGRARLALHTAFDDPTTPAGAPPRESIEIRAFALFD